MTTKSSIGNHVHPQKRSGVKHARDRLNARASQTGRLQERKENMKRNIKIKSKNTISALYIISKIIVIILIRVLFPIMIASHPQQGNVYQQGENNFEINVVVNSNNVHIENRNEMKTAQCEQDK